MVITVSNNSSTLTDTLTDLNLFDYAAADSSLNLNKSVDTKWKLYTWFIPSPSWWNYNLNEILEYRKELETQKSLLFPVKFEPANFCEQVLSKNGST